MMRRLGWLAIPALFLAASSPAIAQWTPRFLLPSLAVAGAAWLVLSLVRAARDHRRGMRRAPLALAVLAVATFLFAVLPLARLVHLMLPASGGPRILTAFGAWRGAEGYPRLDAHRGIDVKGPVGADVLAAADGRVAAARDHQGLCGNIVAVVHDPHGYRTIYCHLAEIAVTTGEPVVRGQRLGALGTTGQRAWPGYEHVHLELQRGSDPNDLHDPLAHVIGCFDAAARYPTDRLVLTYPVRC
ncbi:MAG TPA: M23 family metallopeptidase [Methylomirabilota bacterium]|nr:M23 family metallopeptidase [Methylomirabilota bacterium]